jgi:hypothetical protein
MTTDQKESSTVEAGVAEKQPDPVVPKRTFGIGRVLAGGLIGAAVVGLALSYSGILVPVRVAEELRSQIDIVKAQSDKLRADLELSDRTGREYKSALDGASPQQARSRMDEMQKTIRALQQEIETIRAAEWAPLSEATQDALYRQLSDLPPREVWIGYADSGGRDLARTFSSVFKRLNWTQKYDIIAVLDPEVGLWITPMNDFSAQVRDRIGQATMLQFKLFPHREQLPGGEQIGIIIGYRTPNKEGVNPSLPSE